MNFRTLDLNLLKVFDEVMAEGNLTRAARNLAMTQPAVSNALKRLRDSLDDPLFVRSGYGVEPTAQATAIWPAVRDALTQLRAAIAPPQFDPSTSRATFVLAMADATAALITPGLLARIERDAPGVTLRVLPLTTRDPRALLDSSEIDMAIGHFPAVMAALVLAAMQEGEHENYGHERLYSSHYVCVMRRDHPLAKTRLSLDAFCEARHLLVSFSGRPYGFVDEALAELGRKRRVVLTVNQFFTAGQVVMRSDLLTVLPRHFLAASGIGLRLAQRPLPMSMPEVHVDMIWHRRQDARSEHVWLRSQIMQSVRR